MLRENSSLLFLRIYGEYFIFLPEFFLDCLLFMLLKKLSALLFPWMGIDNHIGAEGARNLSEMLRENSTLLHLDIRGECYAIPFLISSFLFFARSFLIFCFHVECGWMR